MSTAGGSPQRETVIGDRPPINGEGDIQSESSVSSTAPAEPNKVAGPSMNVGISGSGNSSGDALQPSQSNARPASGMVTSPRSPGQQPVSPMNRAGVVPMTRMSGGGGGGGQPPSQSGWGQSNQYGTRPRYRSDMSPSGYGNYQSRPHSNQSSGEMISKTNLYIRALDPNTADQDLINMCQNFGKIRSTKAIVDQMTNKCKGYGFVDFEKPSDAERAMHALQQRGIQAQMAKVREGSLEQDPTNLYFANLPSFIDERYLESMVRPYGPVVSVRILRDDAGRSRNVGFCRMDSRETCDRIIYELNKKPLPNSKDLLLVKFADSGNKRKREFRQQQHALMNYDGMQHGPLGGQLMSQGNVNMNARYSMQPMANQPNYIQNTAAAGNWGGVPMYPQVAMSPVTGAAVTSMPNTIMDPTSALANQLSQMQLAAGHNYGLQQNQQTYPQLYQSQAMMPPFQYEVSASPPTQLAHGTIEDHTYANFGQM